jgi:hypothetical protein
MTFSEFIATRKITNTPRGDFLEDTKTLINCKKFPAVTSWGDLYCFMRGRRACDEAIAEGRKLWAQYKKSLNVEDIVS